MTIQRGESPDKAKLSAFGRKVERGESPDHAKLSAFGKRKECAHEEQPALVLDEKRRPRTPSGPMRFVSLHHHSTYSYLDGFQLPDAHVRRAGELNMNALAMTEHGNVFSHAKFEQAAKEQGVKPIFGLEAYCGEIDAERRSQTKNHLTILAKDQEGYRNLLTLVSASWKEGFYYEPTVGGKLLGEHRNGLVVLSGCQGSLLFTSLVGGKGIPLEAASYRRARSVASRFKRAFNGNYFIEVQAFPELPATCQANPLLARIARELHIPLVATLDCHYTLPTEKEIQKVLHSVRNNGTVEEVAREWGYEAELCPPLSDKDLWRKLIATGLTRQEASAAILASEEIAQDCNVTLPRLEMVRYQWSEGYDLQPWSKSEQETSRSSDLAGCQPRPALDMQDVRGKDKHSEREVIRISRRSSPKRERVGPQDQEHVGSSLGLSRKTPYEGVDAEPQNETGTTKISQRYSQNSGTSSKNTGETTEIDIWRHWLREGWKFRKIDKLHPSERKRYKERLKYEMSIIEDKDYVSYFLIVSDLVRFAKDADIGVGPARGSAAASLVCWLLRITEVNPMLFPHLVFERFIDLTREDLPDIDLDFESVRRGEIVDYLVAKYGRDQVSNIGTFTKYKSKNALDDVARVYQIPRYEVEQIKGVLLERSSGDLRASATIEDTIEQFEQARSVVERHPEIMTATELEGNVKGFGIHAAGVAISNQPITEVCAILEREVKKRTVQVIAVDKYDAEYLGILKIDLLAISALDALVDMCRMLGEKPRFLYDIPIEDEEVVHGFQENDVVGIFQYEGRAMRMVCGSVKPDDFSEVCHITALARPGPLHNGAVASYVDIKRGVEQPSILHPALEAITRFTQYQVVYQEQILRIVREIGGFDWTHAAYIRKIISRKLGDQEFNRQWERFWEGAQRLPNMDEETARSIWGLCTTAGSYAFNAAHSISYGYIAWWTMWFKKHHPDIFFAAMLHRASQKSGGDSSNAKASVQSKARLDPQVIMIRDALNAAGFSRPRMEIKPLSVRESGLTWQREGENELRPGFLQVPGIGDSMAERILAWRETVQDGRGLGWASLIDVNGIGEKKLNVICQFAESDDPFNITRLDRMIDAVKKDLSKLGLPQPTHTAVEVPYERSEDDEEVIWVGVAVHRNLRDIFEVNRARTGEELDPATVRDPDLNEWMLIAGYDGTDLLSLRVTRWKYPKMKNRLWKIKLNEDVLVVRGIKRGWRTAREIQVSDIWVVDPEID